VYIRKEKIIEDRLFLNKMTKMGIPKSNKSLEEMLRSAYTPFKRSERSAWQWDEARRMTDNLFLVYKEIRKKPKEGDWGDWEIGERLTTGTLVQAARDVDLDPVALANRIDGAVFLEVPRWKKMEDLDIFVKNCQQIKTVRRTQRRLIFLRLGPEVAGWWISLKQVSPSQVYFPAVRRPPPKNRRRSSSAPEMSEEGNTKMKDQKKKSEKEKQERPKSWGPDPEGPAPSASFQQHMKRQNEDQRRRNSENRQKHLEGKGSTAEIPPKIPEQEAEEETSSEDDIFFPSEEGAEPTTSKKTEIQ
jgi:hypothetical protein